MKTLYIFVNDCGDGSYSLRYTLDDKLIEQINAAYDEGRLNYGTFPGIDGDGLNYKKLMLPDDVTYESLGISKFSIITENDIEPN